MNSHPALGCSIDCIKELAHAMAVVVIAGELQLLISLMTFS